MKKIFMNAALVVAGLMMLGCGASGDAKLKKDIVGKYHHVQTANEAGMSVTIESDLAFNADATTSLNATIDMVLTMDDLAIFGVTEPLSFKYEMSVSGTYDIKNSYLVYHYDTENLKMDLIESHVGEIGELFDSMLKPMLDAQILPSLKQQMLANNKEKIVSISEENMIVETIEGQMVYVREE